MALSGSVLGGLISGNLASDGASGPKRDSASDAIATGIVNEIVGSSFQTTDTGQGSGGSGTGTGLTGMSASTMASVATGNMSSTGPKGAGAMLAIMQAVVQHLASASLASTNPSVGQGSATIVAGSISTTRAALKGAIKAALQGDGASGPELDNFSDSIALGVYTGLQQATGSLVISGPSGDPSSGSGTGTIS